MFIHVCFYVILKERLKKPLFIEILPVRYKRKYAYFKISRKNDGKLKIFFVIIKFPIFVKFLIKRLANNHMR